MTEEAVSASGAAARVELLARGPAFAVVALGVGAAGIGSLLRISLLDAESLWLDELWTLDAVSRDFREMVGARLVSDQSPPLWTMLAWAWLRIVGTYDAAAVRLLPALLGIGAIAVPLVGAARMHRLRPTLLVMASFLAISFFAIQYSVEFRAYSLMIALGSASTVIWAGLISGELPRTGRWLFTFAFTGALGGFAHYYGNVPYLLESALLILVLAVDRARRPLITHLAWAAVSMVPLAAWYLFTRTWARNEAVADPPSLLFLKQAATYAFAPITNALTASRSAYADGSDLVGLAVVGAVVVGTIAVAGTRLAVGRSDRLGVGVVGALASVVVGIGVGVAWTASLLLPPSMNVRNLSALLPALFLAASTAVTMARRPARRDLAASASVALLLVSVAGFVGANGLRSLAPPWQEQAGYRDAARALLAAADESPMPTLLGLEAAWAWHGQWDAALAARVRAAPRGSSDPSPLPVVWVLEPGQIPSELPSGPLIVFADDSGTQIGPVFDWARATRGPCESWGFGGPGIGRVEMLRCG